MAILVPEATADHVRVSAYNLDSNPVKAVMTGWDVDPGTWSMTVGGGPAQTIPFERSSGVDVTFAPRATTTIELRLVSKGMPYWSRPDLGIGEDDVRVSGRSMRVTVHSLGAVASPTARVVVRDAGGREVARASVPALPAPSDLRPRTAVVAVALPAASWTAGSVTVGIPGGMPEITQQNNAVRR